MIMSRLLLILALVTQAAAPLVRGQMVIRGSFAVNEPIPDAAELLNVQTIGIEGATLVEAQVFLNIAGRSSGGFNGDIYAALSHDTGYSVLLNRTGKLTPGGVGYGDDGFNVVLADSASSDIHNYRYVLSGSHSTPVEGALTGTWQPDGRNVPPDDVLDTTPRTAMLSALNGLSVGGEWRLLLDDNSAGGTSQLVAWGLSIQTAATPAGPQHFAGYEFEFLAEHQVLNDALALTGQNTLVGPCGATFAGIVSGTGGLVHSGSGELVLLGANTFTGGLRVNSGVLSVGHDNALGGGELILNGGTLRPYGGARQFNNPVSVLAASTIDTPYDLSLSGVISGSGALAKTGAGQLAISGEHPAYTGCVQVGAGKLFLTGSMPAASFLVTSGGMLAGQGRAGAVTIGSGGILSPGASPGEIRLGDTLWAGGGTYLWQINDAMGTAGASPGWDLASILGTLTITADANNRFCISLVTLTLPSPPDTAGSASGFDPARRYVWRIATATSGISGFAPAWFSIDPAGFANPLGGGAFSLQQSGNDLQLVFIPVPELGVAPLASVLGLLGFALWRRRRLLFAACQRR
jgi:autotransporter-associated beta strand protein